MNLKQAIGKLDQLRQQFEALGALGEILETARELEGRVQHKADLERDIAELEARRARLQDEDQKAREAHQKLLADLASEEHQARTETAQARARIEGELERARKAAEEMVQLAQRQLAAAMPVPAAITAPANSPEAKPVADGDGEPKPAA